MADDSEDGPAVPLGEGDPVEGAPLARVSARLMWGIEKSTVSEREGETTIRTPDGPRELDEILDEVERTYFDTRQSFEEAVHEVIGRGPVPTTGEDTDAGEEDTDAEEDADAEDADAEDADAEDADADEDENSE